MPILTRMVNMFRADVNGLMDQVEDKELLLKQSLKDMEEALAQNRLHLKSVLQCKEAMSSSAKRLEQAVAELAPGLEIAVRNGKDDLARELIRRKKTWQARRKEQMEKSEDLEKQAGDLEERIQEQQDQLETISLDIKTWRQRKSAPDPFERTADPNGADFGRVSEAEVESELLILKEAMTGGHSA